MKTFRTSIEIKKSLDLIKHSDSIIMMGSCFTENISKKLCYYCYKVFENPFGITYNPASIVNGINRIIEKKTFSHDELLYANETWNTFQHHSKFSHSDKETYLEIINESLNSSNIEFAKANWLIVSLGTSWVYRLKETGEIVNNCHKQSDKYFIRELLNKENIVSLLSECIKNIINLNPGIKIIFTISPIRHLKDGFAMNQWSKSNLICAVNELVDNLNIFYFPSYEIVMDDLRDYRFYEEDMVHINSSAIEYIWDKFSEVYFSKEEQQLNLQIDAIRKVLNHKPSNPTSESYKLLIHKIEEKIMHLNAQYPNLFLIDRIKIK